MQILRLVLGISAVGWFGLALDEWLRSRRQKDAGTLPAATTTRVVEPTRRAA
jgi:hypothetical protein